MLGMKLMNMRIQKGVCVWVGGGGGAPFLAKIQLFSNVKLGSKSH